MATENISEGSKLLNEAERSLASRLANRPMHSATPFHELEFGRWLMGISFEKQDESETLRDAAVPLQHAVRSLASILSTVTKNAGSSNLSLSDNEVSCLLAGVACMQSLSLAMLAAAEEPCRKGN